MAATGRRPPALLRRLKKMGVPEFGPDDPQATDVRSLLEAHLLYAKSHTQPQDVHALEISELVAPDISFFSLRSANHLLGVGALKHLSDDHAEIKSMHIAEAARGTGMGRLLLDHLLDQARARGSSRVSLETGTMPAFAAARSLYRSAGFEVCAPFGEYWSTPDSVCMTLLL